MSVQQVQGLALDPRTKILIWLLANVVVFAWTPEVFRMGVMLAYFVLFLLERKGKMLAGLLLGSRLGTVSVLSYMLLGLAGLPIFSEGGGLWYVFKPSFGYIIGFAVGTFVTGWIAEHMEKKTIARYLLANLAGLFCVYAVGMIYYYIICNFVINTPIAAGPLFLYCFVLAVPGDIALSILGAVVAKRVRPVLAYEAVRVRS